MTVSSIVFGSINENFPAAGQDNDSQGFRDNFARIKTALGTAQTEITYLNTNAVDRTKNNDLGNNTLSNLILKNHGVRSESAVSSAAAVSIITFGDFQYRRYSLPNSTNIFQIDNWPVNCYAEIRLEMISGLGTRRALFQPGVIANSLGSPQQFLHLGQGFGNNNYVDLNRLDQLNRVQRYVFKISSPDGGVNTFVSLEDVFKEQPIS
jgi:hypothetical protein